MHRVRTSRHVQIEAVLSALAAKHAERRTGPSIFGGVLIPSASGTRHGLGGVTSCALGAAATARMLAREFTSDAPNQRWVGDTTELVIGAGAKLYLAVLLDLFSRFIVGRALSAVNDRHLVVRALRMAIERRCPGAGLLHHSDRGYTYASED